MGLKGWLHLVAALLGLSLAALIVFLVFGQASEQGQVSGQAPGEESVCASINAARAREASTIETAAGNLPTILNASQVEVTPSKEQAPWFANLQASSGICLDEVVVLPRILRMSASYPEGTSTTQVDAYTMDTLARSFEPPLARTRVELATLVGDDKRSIMVRQEGWTAFEEGRAALGLDRSVKGLQAYGKRTDFDTRFISVTGW